MNFKVMGGGCPKCKTLKEIVQKVLVELGRDEQVEYITDMNEIIKAGLMITPAWLIMIRW